jgi:hypothetical protein
MIILFYEGNSLFLVLPLENIFTLIFFKIGFPYDNNYHLVMLLQSHNTHGV